MILFEKEDIEELIFLLATRLNTAGISGKISIVGGAALSVAYIPERSATMDIETLYELFHHQEVLSPTTRTGVLRMLNSNL